MSITKSAMALIVCLGLLSLGCAETLEDTRDTASGKQKQKEQSSSSCYGLQQVDAAGVNRASAAGLTSTKTAPSFNIVNGESAVGDQDFKAVGLLIRDIRGMDLGGDFEICTGTFVSSTTMITAAHCIGNVDKEGKPDPTGGVRFYKGDSVKIASMRQLEQALSDDFSVAPLKAVYTVEGIVGKNSKKGANEIAQHDLAVLIFPAGTAPAYKPILKTRPRYSQAVTIVGFGKTSLQENATLPDTISKRRGTNKEFFLGPSHAPHSFVLQGAADGSDNQALGSSGDSGGGFFIAGKSKDGRGVDYYLAGVFSTGGINQRTGKGDGLYADLTGLDPASGKDHIDERKLLYETATKAGAIFTFAEPDEDALAVTGAARCF